MLTARHLRPAGLVTALVAACSGGSSGTPDAAAIDADPTTTDAARPSCANPPTPSALPLSPRAGELYYAQLALGGISTGEAALVVGPNGTSVLIDVGNDSHDDDLEAVLTDTLGEAAVDVVLVTHFHADHGDGIADLDGRITIRQGVIYRGLTDLHPAANATTAQRVCEVAAAHAGSVAICEAAAAVSCDPADWDGVAAAVDCPGLATADLPLGGGALLDVLAADGVIDAARATHRYETEVGPMATGDGNGENARSVVAVLRHGAFRLLLAGDLTGGGSDTDDVESFYAPHLADAAGLGAVGVDVLHAGHHGRDTSSNPTWLAALLPADGRPRQVVMGVSTAHLGSPHEAVLAAIAPRLAGGSTWTTTIATGGATGPALIDAGGGRIVVATRDGGAAYDVQALDADGGVVASAAFWSVGACATGD